MPDTPPPRRAPLTPRQIQILAGIARGQSNAQIGEALGLTAEGVRSHVGRICQQLGTSSRVALVAYGYQHGLLAGLAPEPRIITHVTTRQRQLLALMAQGLSTAEIADQLHLAAHTVTSHARRLYAQLQATGRPHAVALAYQHGLLTTPAYRPRTAAA